MTISTFILLSCENEIKTYYSTGELKSRVELRDGESHILEYYKTGQIKEKYNKMDNLINGDFTSFYKNGSKKMELLFKNGLRNGQAYFFTKNKNLRSSVLYYDDEVFYKKVISYDSLEKNIISEYILINPIIRVNNPIIEHGNGLRVLYILPKVPIEYNRKNLFLKSKIKLFEKDSLIDILTVEGESFVESDTVSTIIDISDSDSIKIEGNMDYILNNDTNEYDQFHRSIVLNLKEE